MALEKPGLTVNWSAMIEESGGGEGFVSRGTANFAGRTFTSSHLVLSDALAGASSRRIQRQDASAALCILSPRCSCFCFAAESWPPDGHNLLRPQVRQSEV